MQNDIIDQCRHVGKTLIEEYKSNSTIFSGINGPYDDQETRVRNLSHLIVITAVEILRYGNKEYSIILKKMGKDLLEQRNEEGLFVMREKFGKDRSNGVIGHAWVLEALLYLYQCTGESEYMVVAENIMTKHEFVETVGFWKSPEYIRNHSAIDYTFNHQLWYAASCAEVNSVLKRGKYSKEINVFLNTITLNMAIRKNGRIVHEASMHMGLVNKVKQKIKRILNSMKEATHLPSHAYKEEGYHIFNLMAFARLYKQYPQHSFWKTKKFKKILEYLNSNELKQALLSSELDLDSSFINHLKENDERSINIYGYPYNVPGLEMPYIYHVFPNEVELSVAEYYFTTQYKLTFDKKSNRFETHCHDKHTVNYRVYELYKYLEVS